MAGVARERIDFLLVAVARQPPCGGLGNMAAGDEADLGLAGPETRTERTRITSVIVNETCASAGILYCLLVLLH